MLNHYLQIKTCEDFVARDGEFGLQDAKGVVEEVGKLWLEIQLEPEVVLCIKLGIYKSGVALEYRLLRRFLAYGSHRLTNESSEVKRVQRSQQDDSRSKLRYWSS